MVAQPTTIGIDPRGGRPVVPSAGRWRPLGLGEVSLTDGFWATLQATNASATFAHCEEWMERLGWLANFDRVAANATGPDRPGWNFSDSEVYKLVEAMCWEFGRTGDPTLDRTISRLTARIGRAQDEDGYLNTYFGHHGRPPRYSDLEMGHELYCTGHLLQAAVARLRTVGPDELVEIARRAADHVCDTFGTDGFPGICGHPEIEVGLLEFGRALNEPRYMQQAGVFLERRGQGTLREIPLGRAYFQDDVPIRNADAWRGHAVRALYLAAAAADVAVETGDAELLAAIQRQWRHTVARRTYITGGMGSRHQDEGFGEDWELPADRAYCETCAGAASIMVSWRLFLATGRAEYGDLIERTSYNVIATSPRSDGRAFFYANSLHQRVPAGVPDDSQIGPRAESGTRAAWFDVSCCPTNVARTLATWHLYTAAAGHRELALLQYAGSRITAELGDGRCIGVDVETAYPDDGTVTVRVNEPPAGAVALHLRIPQWAVGAVLQEGGRRYEVAPGLAVIDREFRAGEEIRLHLPMEPRFTWPDNRIDALRGSVAIERGPLVFCAESVDLSDGIDLDEINVDTNVPPADRGGHVVVRGVTRSRATAEPGWPYARSGPPEIHSTDSAVDLVLVPYHQWAERGPTAMRVWLPVAR